MSIKLQPWVVADLQRSGISQDVAESVGIRSVDRSEYNEILGFAFSEMPEGFVIPFYDPVTGHPMRTPDGRPYVRIKLEHPVIIDGSPAKYLSPRQGGQHAYFPPGIHNQILNAEMPVLLTEGEKKALRCSISGPPVIGLTGNWGFTQSSTGDLLDELKPYATTNRNWYVIWDSDALINFDFAAATHKLKVYLQTRKVNLHILIFPTSDITIKVGLDDYLCAHPVNDFVALLQAAKPVEDNDTADSIYEKGLIRFAKELKV